MTGRMHALIPLLAALLVGPTALASGAEEPWELTPQGWRSGPIIEHVGQLPAEAGGAIGAVTHGDFLYVSGSRSFSIYDVTQPENPVLVSIRPTPYVLSEHPDTNGEILILSADVLGFARLLEVWNVEDKAAPTRVGSYVSGTMGRGDHTWTCVLDCSFAYGSHGSIVDLSDPTSPQKVGDWRQEDGRWRRGFDPEQQPAPRFHGIDEVAPGIVLTASEPTVALDARGDPANPAVLAYARPPVTTAGLNRRSIPSYAHWPRNASERFALETIETPFSGPCTEGSGGLVTYDTSRHRQTGRFRITDVFRLTENGTFTDGQPPANAVGCSAFGLDESPDWPDDRLVAMAAMEHGLRLLHVDEDGRITEIGGFIGHGTEAAFPVWGTRRVLYVADLTRGVDIFRVAEPDGS